MILFALAAALSTPNTPIAKGPEPSIAAATRAARKCGMRNIRHDPLDDGRSLLLIGNGNSRKALSCTFTWLKDHGDELQFEPLFFGNERG